MIINKPSNIISIMRNRKIGLNNFRETYYEICREMCDDEDIIIRDFFKSKGVDLNKKTNTIEFPFEGEETFDFLSEAQRERKQVLQNKMRAAIIKTEFNLLEGNDLIKEHPHYKKDSRDFPVFFNANREPSDQLLDGMSVLGYLSNESNPVDKKNELFSKYLDDMFNSFIKYNKPYSDEEFIENYDKLRPIASAFSCSYVTEMFESVAKCKLDENIQNKLKEYHEFVGLCNNEIAGRVEKISDPAYTYMDDKNFEKFSQKVSASLCMSDHKRFNNKELGIKNEISHKYWTYAQSKRTTKAHKSSLDLLERTGVIGENPTYVGENGPIDKETAIGLIQDHKFVGAINKTGKMKAVSITHEITVKAQDIGEKFDKKAAFKGMLNELDKGTGLFIKSSKEYKRMRTLLSNLSEGKGNEANDIKEIKELSDKYLDDFNYKPKISGTAVKRRDCVVNMLYKLEAFEVEQSLGEQLRQYKALTRQNANENGRHHIDFVENIEPNSSGEIYKQQTGQMDMDMTNGMVNEEPTNTNS